MPINVDKRLKFFSKLLTNDDLNTLVEYEKYANIHIYNQKHEYVWFWEEKEVKLRMYYQLRKLLQTFNI